MNDELMEISMEGFQVVSGEMFRRVFRINAPTATLWPSSIGFNKASFVALNNCERIRIEVNANKRCILIVPVTEKDKDGVQWVTKGKDPSVRKIECSAFTKQLYEYWGWKSNTAYRATGRVVSADKKVMVLFDFNKAETWTLKEKVKEFLP